MKALIVFLIIGSGLFFLLFFMYISYDNRYVELKNGYEAQVAQDQIVYDEMWKIIQQQAGVTENYSESFRKNYKEIMQSRNYGGELMKWITESNPNFSTAMYEKLMVSIETYRTKFTTVQTKLI
ncbi:MAG: hypothetical protein HC836_31720 [Richelia sp. RM2_1_2]|nr:hypothetical protein [Richelia sp. RM2_1_2]